jgi:hypothetical protein
MNAKIIECTWCDVESVYCAGTTAFQGKEQEKYAKDAF